jgi:hypothetical protein
MTCTHSLYNLTCNEFYGGLSVGYHKGLSNNSIQGEIGFGAKFFPNSQQTAALSFGVLYSGYIQNSDTQKATFDSIKVPLGVKIFFGNVGEDYKLVELTANLANLHLGREKVETPGMPASSHVDYSVYSSLMVGLNLYKTFQVSAVLGFPAYTGVEMGWNIGVQAELSPRWTRWM